MRPEDKKYIWWGLLGIGVAALFYFLSASKQSSNANTVTVPYLVPQYQKSTGASPTADTSLSTQPNIIGSSPNSTVPNYSNPYGPATSVGEAPNTWGFMPILTVTNPNQPVNTFPGWIYNTDPTHRILSNGISGNQIPLHVYTTPGGFVTQ